MNEILALKMLNEVENTLLPKIKKAFPGHDVSLSNDPDAFDIYSVDIYGIPKAEKNATRQALWDLIDALKLDLGFAYVFELVPAVHTFEKQ